MKRIGIILSLLAMILTGCEKIQDHIEAMQDEAKADISEIFDPIMDSKQADSGFNMPALADTSLISSYNIPLWKAPYSSTFDYPQHKMTRLDSSIGIRSVKPQLNNNIFSKPLWSMDTLSLGNSTASMDEIYHMSH